MKKLLTTGFWLLLGLSLFAGCGGGGSAISTGTPPPHVSRSPIVSHSPTPSPMPPSANAVTITHNSTLIPNSATAIDMNQSYSLTATVSNDPTNRGVNWTVTCIINSPCGGMVKTSSGNGAANAYKAVSPLQYYEAQVTAASAADPTKSASVHVTVNPTPSLFMFPTWPTGNVGQRFGLNIVDQVAGGSAPFTCSINSGALPTGLALVDPTHIGGIPTTIASAVVVAFICADSANPPISVNVPVSFTINPMLPLAISSPVSGALPNGTVGLLYNHHCWGGRGGPGGCSSGVQVQTTGGFQPYVFSWVAAPGSSLPPGLNFSGGVIAGTPTTAGTYNFVVTVTDSESPPRQVSANYTITVAP